MRHQHGDSQVVGDDVFTVLQDELDRDDGDPEVSWVGYLGYACRRDLPARPGDPARGVPDAVWMRVRSPHPLPTPARTSYGTVAGATSSYDVRRGEGESEGSVPADYAAAFAQVQAELHAGNSYEVNLTYREQVASAVDPVSAYLRLRAANPAPYSGYLQHHGVHLLSSSPERYATVDRHRVLEARPIKGTTPRGRTPEEDRALAELLRTDAKLRSENLMITDLMRNDLAQVCDVGLGRGAVADGCGVLRRGAPARHDRAGPSARGRHDGGSAPLALPGRLHDRGPQAPHDVDHRRGGGHPARGVRRRVRLDLRRRPGRPERGDPQPGGHPATGSGGATRWAQEAG